MSRDMLRSNQYFDEFITYENDRILKFSSILEKLPYNDENKVRQCESYISSFYKSKISAMYSRGDNKSMIYSEFLEYISHLGKCGIPSYADMIDVLSMAILFQYSGGSFLSLIEEEKYDDSLVLYLKQVVNGEKYNTIGNELKYSEQYERFFYILTKLDNKEEVIENLTNFMNGEWYTLNSEMSWYDSHRSSQNTYCGYWCWLGAAILKIKNIGTFDIPECRYIPFDLL